MGNFNRTVTGMLAMGATLCALASNPETITPASAVASSAAGVPATRALRFRPGPDGRVNAEAVAQALAARLPAISQFGPAREGKRTYDNIEISAAGTRYSGNWSASLTGVRAAARGRNVFVAYINGSTGSKGDSLGSTTIATLEVSASAEDPTVFSVKLVEVQEKIARGFLFIKVGPLASQEAVTQDVVASLASVRVSLNLSQQKEEEVESPFPPAAVFANFERMLGSGKSGTATEGRFQMRDGSDGSIPVAVKAFPYRTGSKIQFKFSLPYLVNDDGSNTLDLDQGKRILDALKKIAAD